jgi:hypothetical protein
MTHNEEQYQFLLQCVEDNRRLVPSFHQAVLQNS